jgi:UDP-2,4-diacetamido-2,4,6-trideoxy-beta-L-altropyranose hydrolase
MVVFFRTNASERIGFGHFYRCFSLALSLQKYDSNVEVFFLMNNNHDINNLLDELCKNNFNFFLIDQITKSFDWKYDVKKSLDLIGNKIIDWMVVDCYEIGVKWEKEIKLKTKNIFVIDDLANRMHDCDILLDQNLHKQSEEKYLSLVSSGCKLLLGPKNSILRQEFTDASLPNRERLEKVDNVLIYLGGGEKVYDFLMIIIKGLTLEKLFHLNLDIIFSGSNSEITKIKDLCVFFESYNVIKSTSSISKYINKADLAIGTCGNSAWERCFFGLPSIVMITAENQKEDAEILNDLGAVINIGYAKNLNSENFGKIVKSLIFDKQKLKNMSAQSLSIVHPHNPVSSLIKTMTEV